MASFIVYGDTSGQVTVKAPAVAGTNTITFPAETGTLYTTTSTAYLNGQIAWNTTVQTTGFTAVAYGGYFCNTTSAAFTVTLPLSPTRGQFVVIVDYAGTAATNNITVSPNGSKINGSGASATIATNRAGITYTYIDATQGWLPSSNVYGTFTQSYTASYLVIAGGAGGAGQCGGGGGAGGFLTGTKTFIAGTVYTATVGGGGTAGAPQGSGGVGSTSSLTGAPISSVSATGGGYGGTGNGFLVGGPGGSGGGGGGRSAAGGSGTPGQGFAGGAAGAGDAGGGGGGSSAVGSTAAGPAQGGAGGAGTASSITGTPVTYAGGGGAGAYATPAAGGSGGGGTGSGNTAPGGTAGFAGTVNLGGGGGGGSGGAPGQTNAAAGGAGGSGVVIISVPTASYSGTYTGTATVTTSGSNTIIKWTTGSGTYTA